MSLVGLGAAYIDVEGLVLYPMFDNHSQRTRGLAETANQSGREMESGLLRLIAALVIRMAKKLGTSDVATLLEYVAGQAAWEFPTLSSETSELSAEARRRWDQHLASLDTAIFSLLGETVVLDAEVETKLDEILVASLFQRRLARHHEGVRQLLLAGLHAGEIRLAQQLACATARVLLGRRRVGRRQGRRRSTIATRELEQLLLTANLSIDLGEQDAAVEAITALAEIAFDIAPFKPEKLIAAWKAFCSGAGSSGQSVADALSESNDEAIQFIEQAFVYNLPWAMEAVRVRAEAHENRVLGRGRTVSSPPVARGFRSSTGALSSAAATLQSRQGSARASPRSAPVTLTSANFDSMSGLKAWLRSEEVSALSTAPDWPTARNRMGCGSNSMVRAARIRLRSGLRPSTRVKSDGLVVRCRRGLLCALAADWGRSAASLPPTLREVGSMDWTPDASGLMTIASTASDSDEMDVDVVIGPGKVKPGLIAATAGSTLPFTDVLILTFRFLLGNQSKFQVPLLPVDK
ncbi:MAG: hypothetical protein U5L03_10010 [Burkholderiaceae bacterium]|nr:hypothetical protein [Burkholderiaceae bacterium]